MSYNANHLKNINLIMMMTVMIIIANLEQMHGCDYRCIYVG